MNNLKTKQMGETHSNGPVPTLISILFGSFALITMKDVQVWFSITSATIAIISGGFAIRYYYLAIKEKKRSLNQK